MSKKRQKLTSGDGVVKFDYSQLNKEEEERNLALRLHYSNSNMEKVKVRDQYTGEEFSYDIIKPIEDYDDKQISDFVSKRSKLYPNTERKYRDRKIKKVLEAVDAAMLVRNKAGSGSNGIGDTAAKRNEIRRMNYKNNTNVKMNVSTSSSPSLASKRKRNMDYEDFRKCIE